MGEQNEVTRKVELTDRNKENTSEFEKLGDVFLFRIAEALRDKTRNSKNLQIVLHELAQKIIEVSYPKGSRVEARRGYTVFDVALVIPGMEDFIPLENNDRIFVSDKLKNPLKIELKFLPGQIKGDKFLSWFSQEEHAIAFVELFPNSIEQRNEDNTLQSLSLEFPTRFLLDSLDPSELEAEGNEILSKLRSLLQNGGDKDDAAICNVLSSLGKRIYELIDFDTKSITLQPAYNDLDYRRYRLDLGNGTAGQRIFLSDKCPYFEEGVWSLYFPDSAGWGLEFRKAFSVLFPNAQKEETQQSCYYSLSI